MSISRRRTAAPTWTHHQRPDLVARARQLVEESGLGREAVAATLGVSVATVGVWRRRFGWVWAAGPRRVRSLSAQEASVRTHPGRSAKGRSHPPATVAAARRLVESGATRVAAAAETGATVLTIRRWAVQEGWRVPPRTTTRAAPTPAERAAERERAARFRGGPRFRGGSRRYVPDVVERVRVLVEGSALSQGEIAARCGVSQSTVGRYLHRHGWRRPAEASGWTRLVAVERSGLGPALVAGLGRLAVLAEAEVGPSPPSDPGHPHAEVAGGAGPRSTQDRGASFEAPLRGAPQDEEVDHSERAAFLAAACRRLAAHLGRAGERDAPRLMRPRRRRGGPRSEALVAEARDLVEHTVLSQTEIARRLGIAHATLISWKQQGGWQRRPDAPWPFGARDWAPRLAIRREHRIEARGRLDEAERILAALEAGMVSDIAALEAVFGHLTDAVGLLQRPVGGARRTG